MKEYTKIMIVPHHGKPIEILISQEYIDAERLDILKKGCTRAWQDFIKENNWEITESP